MFESARSWVKEHRKTVITATLLAISGTIAILLINGKKVRMPVKELAGKKIPDAPKAIKSVETVSAIATHSIPEVSKTSELVALEIDGVVKTFPREAFIRQLHDGWKASAAKLAEAEALNIALKPGETLVNACTVTMKAAK